MSGPKTQTNITLRVATWGQWCRRMEDAHLDQDTQYVDSDGRNASFDEVQSQFLGLDISSGRVRKVGRVRTPGLATCLLKHVVTLLRITQVLIQSSCLESAVRSVVSFPLSDDTEFTYLLSHCIVGAAASHSRISGGLCALGLAFRGCNRPVPDGFLDPLLSIIRSLKVRHRLHAATPRRGLQPSRANTGITRNERWGT